MFASGTKRSPARYAVNATTGPRAFAGSPFSSRRYDPSRPPDTVVAKSAPRARAAVGTRERVQQERMVRRRAARRGRPGRRRGVRRRTAVRRRAHAAEGRSATPGATTYIPCAAAPASSSKACSAKASGASSLTFAFVPSTPTFSRISRAPSCEGTPASRIASASLRATSRKSARRRGRRGPTSGSRRPGSRARAARRKCDATPTPYASRSVRRNTRPTPRRCASCASAAASKIRFGARRA